MLKITQKGTVTARLQIQVDLTQMLVIKTLALGAQPHPPYLGTWASRWHRCLGVQRDPGVHRSQSQRSHCPHRKSRVVSPGLPWSWGLHRSLDFKEKGRKQSGGPERRTWGGGEKIKRQSEEPEKQETVGWGGPGRPYYLYPCLPELRPLSCSKPPDSRLRSPSCWPRSQMSPGKAS